MFLDICLLLIHLPEAILQLSQLFLYFYTKKSYFIMIISNLAHLTLQLFIFYLFFLISDTFKIRSLAHNTLSQCKIFLFNFLKFFSS